ncbi:MAG: replication protein [Saprospiraceae bacterium]|nr:replication protein [Bacteroidota bacterium]MBK8642351.1 replication protein [Candidatus Vicinibacter affinis]
MIFKHTQVPNILFDTHLPDLTESELKILLVIIRQTNGWIDKFTGKRKTKDRITQSQFIIKTGLSKRIISKTLKMLSDKNFISIYDRKHNLVKNAIDRRGKSILLYSLNPMHFTTTTNAQRDTGLVQKSAYNKRNYKKENLTKGSSLPIRQNTTGTIGEIIEQSKYQALLRL